MNPLRITFLGLSITSSWGNGHATNYRGLVRALSVAGHDVLFLERDVPWYASARDLEQVPWGRTVLYRSVEELRDEYRDDIRQSDVVIVGSYVPDGIDVGEFVTATAQGVCVFYDIDTPVTLAALARGDCDYLAAELLPRFDLYLSFTGGPTLREIERRWGAPRARAFYCLVDTEQYTPMAARPRWDLGYLGTYSDDRQPALERLLLEVARRNPSYAFAVAGPQYPEMIEWPSNVERFEHLAPPDHAAFYAAQRATLNITRADMIRTGWSPSVRLFEAAACATPVISDRWAGIESFFIPDKEILLADHAGDVTRHLSRSAEELARVGWAARDRVLSEHTADHRAAELVDHVNAVRLRERRNS